MNLRNKSIVFVGILIILSFMVVAYLIGEKMTLTARKMSVDLAVSKAQNSFLVVKNELEERSKQTEVIANALEELLLIDNFNENIVREVLQSGLAGSNELNGRWFINNLERSGENLWCQKSGEEIVKRTISEKQKELFQKMKKQNAPMISSPYQTEAGRLLMSFISPIRKNDRITGAVGADIDLYRFQQHFYDNRSLGSAYVTILTQLGYCITHPEENLIGQRLDTLADADQVSLALNTGEKYQAEVQSEFLELPVMRVYQPIKIGSTDQLWLITVSVPLFNVRETVSEIRNSTLLIGLVLALLLMFFLYFSQRRWLYEFTQRQRAEVKHRNVLYKLSSIMESSDQIMIFSVGRNYEYTSFNTVHKENIRKYEKAGVAVGMNFLDTYEGDFRIQMRKYLDRALNGDHFLVEYQRKGIYYQQIFNAITDEKGAVVGVSSFRFDISETVELRRRAREEEEEKVKAQLKNLKNQINPHFLFNSLNSLYALVEGEPTLARQFIVKLSKVYRYLLDSNNSNLIQLKQELEFIKHYLFLQKIRFGDNLKLEEEISSELLSKQLPSVSLQSLVENAIKHNVITSEKPLTIRIYTNGNEELIVENQYQPRTDMLHSSGTGLKNLEALYQFLGNYKPVYGVENGYFRVSIPLI